jgi:hypothetical protein
VSIQWTERASCCHAMCTPYCHQKMKICGKTQPAHAADVVQRKLP